MAVKGPRRQEPLTLGDRLVSAFLGGLSGVGTMLVIWLIVLSTGLRIGAEPAFPFVWVWGGGAVAAVLGLVLGPERMLDALGVVWEVIGRLLRGDRD